MNYHIVRMNETLQKIALIYNLSVDEIKSINKHIRNWDNIIAGTKLNLPAIPDALKDNLNDIEPFIEEYYPRYNEIDTLVEEEEKEIEIEDIKSDVVESIVSKPNDSLTAKKNVSVNYPKMPIFYNGYYPPYMYNYPYYYRNRRKKK